MRFIYVTMPNWRELHQALLPSCGNIRTKSECAVCGTDWLTECGGHARIGYHQMISALMERESDWSNNRHCLCCGLAFHPQFNACILFSRTCFADKIGSLLYASEKAGALSNLAPHKFGQNRDDLSFADRFALFSFTAICCFMRRPICNDKNHQPLPSEQTTIGHNYCYPSPFLN